MCKDTVEVNTISNNLSVRSQVGRAINENTQAWSNISNHSVAFYRVPLRVLFIQILKFVEFLLVFHGNTLISWKYGGSPVFTAWIMFQSSYIPETHYVIEFWKSENLVSFKCYRNTFYCFVSCKVQWYYIRTFSWIVKVFSVAFILNTMSLVPWLLCTKLLFLLNWLDVC